MNFFIDNFHLRNHRPQCKRKNNLKNASDADIQGVNSQICEQTFSWFSQFQRITRHMNADNFLVFVLCMCHFHNKRQMNKM